MKKVIFTMSMKKRGGNRKKLKKITKRCLDSFIQDFCGQHISLHSNGEGVLRGHEYLKRNLLEEKIILSDTDTSVESAPSNLLLTPSRKTKRKHKIFIDLSHDPNQEEVIDLTESINSPTVIDISEDDSKYQQNLQTENDDIFVIGTFNKNSTFTKKFESSSIIKFSNECNNFNNLVSSKNKKTKKKYLKKSTAFCKVKNKDLNQFRKNICETKQKPSNVVKVRENIYVNSPTKLPSSGLRPIIIDGSNVAFVHSNFNFSCKRLEICINYFKEKGHKVTAFVPQYRMGYHRSDDPQLLRRLERQGDLVLTPSKKVDGKNIVPYDDRFIVQTAVLKGGVIVSRDNYNDLLKENPDWAETIKYRTLAFTWVDDVLMFPKDPLGEYGPSLEEFLRFP